jgi:hypothetical protein
MAQVCPQPAGSRRAHPGIPIGEQRAEALDALGAADRAQHRSSGERTSASS